MIATTEPDSSRADHHQRQALIAISHEGKKAWDVEMDDHTTKAKY
jgi:hypothetical protein